jgi:hypothetical protein
MYVYVYPLFTLFSSFSEVSPCTVKFSCSHEIHEGICLGEVYIHSFVILAGRAVSGQILASAVLFVGEKDTANHSVGVWMGPRADLEVLKKREFSFLARGGNGTTISPPSLH